MNFFRTLFSFGILFLSAPGIYGEEEIKKYSPDYEYVRGEDPEVDSIYDMTLGYNDLLAAKKNAVLADKLMQNVAEPEMMAEANKMMEGEESQKEMSQSEKSKKLKEAKAKESMEDHVNAMTESEVMSEALKMTEDPEFMEQMKAMAQDPTFRHYMSAMRDRVKDPEMKAHMDMINEDFKSEL